MHGLQFRGLTAISNVILSICFFSCHDVIYTDTYLCMFFLILYHVTAWGSNWSCPTPKQNEVLILFIYVVFCLYEILFSCLSSSNCVLIIPYVSLSVIFIYALQKPQWFLFKVASLNCTAYILHNKIHVIYNYHTALQDFWAMLTVFPNSFFSQNALPPVWNHKALP